MVSTLEFYYPPAPLAVEEVGPVTVENENTKLNLNGEIFGFTIRDASGKVCDPRGFSLVLADTTFELAYDGTIDIMLTTRQKQVRNLARRNVGVVIEDIDDGEIKARLRTSINFSAVDSIRIVINENTNQDSSYPLSVRAFRYVVLQEKSVRKVVV